MCSCALKCDFHMNGVGIRIFFMFTYSYVSMYVLCAQAQTHTQAYIHSRRVKAYARLEFHTLVLSLNRLAEQRT
jgi:hypothetical protein